MVRKMARTRTTRTRRRLTDEEVSRIECRKRARSGKPSASDAMLNSSAISLLSGLPSSCSLKWKSDECVLTGGDCSMCLDSMRVEGSGLMYREEGAVSLDGVDDRDKGFCGLVQVCKQGHFMHSRCFDSYVEKKLRLLGGVLSGVRRYLRDREGERVDEAYDQRMMSLKSGFEEMLLKISDEKIACPLCREENTLNDLRVLQYNMQSSIIDSMVFRTPVKQNKLWTLSTPRCHHEKMLLPIYNRCPYCGLDVSCLETLREHLLESCHVIKCDICEASEDHQGMDYTSLLSHFHSHRKYEENREAVEELLEQSVYDEEEVLNDVNGNYNDHIINPHLFDRMSLLRCISECPEDRLTLARECLNVVLAKPNEIFKALQSTSNYVSNPQGSLPTERERDLACSYKSMNSLVFSSRVQSVPFDSVESLFRHPQPPPSPSYSPTSPTYTPTSPTYTPGTPLAQQLSPILID